MNKKIQNFIVFLYLIALATSILLQSYNFTNVNSVVVIIRFLILFSFYLLVSKNRNTTFLILLMLNILGDLIFIQNTYYSALFSLGIFIVINLVLSLLVYNYQIKLKSSTFETFITPASILTILLGYIITTLTESVQYLYIVYSLSFILLTYNSIQYYIKSKRSEVIWMLLGALFLAISAGFSALYEFVNTNELYVALDTLFYGVSLLCITKSVIFEDNSSSQLKNSSFID